jgi:hypothetical protein
MLEDRGFEIIHLDYIGDALAVILSTASGIIGVLPKFLKRVRLGWLATASAIVVKIPEYIYLFAIRMGLNPQRWSRCKTLPMGFTFLARKRVLGEGHPA